MSPAKFTPNSETAHFKHSRSNITKVPPQRAKHKHLNKYSSGRTRATESFFFFARWLGRTWVELDLWNGRRVLVKNPIISHFPHSTVAFSPHPPCICSVRPLGWTVSTRVAAGSLAPPLQLLRLGLRGVAHILKKSVP